MKRFAHYVRRIAYFLLFWFLLVGVEIKLNIMSVEYVPATNTVILYSYQQAGQSLNTITSEYAPVTEVLDIIIVFLVDVVLSVDLSRIVTQKFEGGRLDKQKMHAPKIKGG